MSSRGLWLYLASSTLFLIVVPRPFLGLLIVQLIVVLALSSVRSVLIHAACVLALNACATLFRLPSDCSGGEPMPSVWWTIPSCLALTYFAYESSRKGVAMRHRLPSALVMWLAHCLYVLAAAFALDSPRQLAVSPILYAVALSALLFCAHGPVLDCPWKQRLGITVLASCGFCLSWLALSATVQPVTKVILKADLSSPWCNAYAITHTAAHVLVLVLSALIAAVACAVVCSYCLSKRLGRLVVGYGLLSRCNAEPESSFVAPNVLFLMTDDMRAEIAGPPYSRGGGTATPNLDRLLSQSTVFTNAHSQGVTCTPSRASVMTGLRQTSTDYWKSGKRMIQNGAPTIPMIFKEAGYQTLGAGKTFHSHLEPKNWDQERSWTEPYIPFDRQGEKDILLPICFGQDQTYFYCPTEAIDDLVDRKVMDEFLPAFERVLSNSSRQPFFAMIGMYKPHMPWMCPSTSFDAINTDTDDFQPQPYKGSTIHFKSSTDGVSPFVHWLWQTRRWWKCWMLGHCPETETTTERRRRLSPTEAEEHKVAHAVRDESGRSSDNRLQYLVAGDRVLISDSVSSAYSKQQPMTREGALAMRKAYRACIHWVDLLLGEVVDTLEADEAVANNTIILMTSDHGYSLGENNLWQKNTIFEQSTHVPLFFRLPPSYRAGLVQRVLTMPAELVDILPTLAALARIEIRTRFHPFSGDALLNASGDVVEFVGERPAFSFTMRCIRDASPWCEAREQIRTTWTIVVVLALLGVILTGLAASVWDRSAAPENEYSARIDEPQTDASNLSGMPRERSVELSTYRRVVDTSLTAQDAPAADATTKVCANWRKRLRQSPLSALHMLSLGVLVVAAAVALGEHASLPPEHACERFDGRWILPDKTDCAGAESMFSEFEYVGMAVRTDTERYVAWFYAEYQAQPIPVAEEFYVYKLGPQPYNTVDQENAIADHRARAEELLKNHLWGLWDDYVSFFG